MSGRPDSNRRPLPWQGSVLPTELLPHYFCEINFTIFTKNVNTFVAGAGFEPATFGL